MIAYFTYNHLPYCQRTKYFNTIIYNNKIKNLIAIINVKKLIKNNKINKNKYISNMIHSTTWFPYIIIK